MKKIIALVLAGLLIFLLAACGQKQTNTQTDTQTEQMEEVKETEAEEVIEQEAEQAEENETESTAEEDTEARTEQLNSTNQCQEGPHVLSQGH